MKTSCIYTGESDGREQPNLETKVWNDDHNLTDRQIDQFMVLGR